MSRLFIMREATMAGLTAHMNCYVNNKLICRLRNGENFAYDTENTIIEFKCSMPNSSVSDPVFLDMRRKNLVTVTIRQGSFKPVITVLDSSVIVDTDYTNVRSCATVFSPTKTVGNYFAIDENSRQWALYKGLFPSWKNDVPRSYHDIVDFELLEDGSSITKGGVGSALVGGFLFGRTGAIVGSITGAKKTKQTCTNLTIKITVNTIGQPTEYIKLITSSTKRESAAYKRELQYAQDILSLLQLMCNEAEQEAKNPPAPAAAPAAEASPIDEIRKYKALMDEGIISEEEFRMKKKQLLGL